MPVLPRPSSVANLSYPSLDPAAFAEFVNMRGYDVTWSKAMPCPNRDPNQPEHERLNCSLCDRAGRIFYDTKVTRMLVSSLSAQPTYMQTGLYESGSAMISTLPGEHLSYQDKIVLHASRIRYSQVLPVAQGQVLFKLRYNALSIERVVANSGSVLTGWECASDGTLRFSNFPKAQFLSVSYMHQPVYIIVDLLHRVREARVLDGVNNAMAEFGTQGVGKIEFSEFDAQVGGHVQS